MYFLKNMFHFKKGIYTFGLLKLNVIIIYCKTNVTYVLEMNLHLFTRKPEHQTL